MRDAIIAAALLAASGALAAPRKAAARHETMIDASFECAVPAGWTSQRGDQGVTLLGPRDESGVAAQISVRYVPPGDPSHKDADAYLARLTAKSSVPMPGWKTGPVTPLAVAGRKARTVERETSEFPPHAAMGAREVAMSEVHVVVPAEKGFYAVFYYVPRTLDKKARPLLKAFLASFKPKL